VTHDQSFPSDGDYLVASLLGAIPAFIAGFYVGLYSSRFGSLAAECFACAAPVAVLAFVAPRWWHLPGLSFGIAFHGGFHVLDGFGDAIRGIVSLPFVILTGERPSFQTYSAVEDPLWFYVVTAIVGFTCAAFRRNAKTQHPSA